MLINQIATPKCLNHHLNSILYFCGSSGCNTTLCIECKQEHITYHKMHGTDPLLLSFSLVVIQVKAQLTSAVRCLNNLLDELESQDFLQQASDAVYLKQKNAGFEKIIGEIESLRWKWRDHLCKIEAKESLEVAKIYYNFDFTWETRQIEERVKATLSFLGKALPNSFHTAKIKGLRSILEEIRALHGGKSQPGQNGGEENDLPQREVRANSRTYTKRPSQLIVPLTPANSHFSNQISQLEAEKILKIPVSPALTIMEDSQVTSPLSGETISLNEFSARRKSKFALSPYSIHNTRRSELQIDTFEMIEEENEAF